MNKNLLRLRLIVCFNTVVLSRELKRLLSLFSSSSSDLFNDSNCNSIPDTSVYYVGGGSDSDGISDRHQQMLINYLYTNTAIKVIYERLGRLVEMCNHARTSCDRI
jgi:hypothetical protein